MKRENFVSYKYAMKCLKCNSQTIVLRYIRHLLRYMRHCQTNVVLLKEDTASMNKKSINEGALELVNSY